jgi:hypothetical protein
MTISVALFVGLLIQVSEFGSSHTIPEAWRRGELAHRTFLLFRRAKILVASTRGDSLHTPAILQCVAEGEQA